jgi:hypothetical protein
MTTVLVLPIKSDPKQASVEKSRKLERGGLRQTSLVGAISFDFGCIDVEKPDFGTLVPERIAIDDAGNALLKGIARSPIDLFSLTRG